ncbi:hypothetical protein S40285_10537 [Stachybotrys chlorohalonatus IBT 40285]|uniref:Uncharacterized protein n=1 Tax=Stachybotrys chlorohalonatus (strain IBT 40285) TaxID=1283841 RepID=A0A084QIM8_STAC4|nr:hypothetical protein S40285_10537 [Stachybotrys chlorohalonata IBT 40285]
MADLPDYEDFVNEGGILPRDPTQGRGPSQNPQNQGARQQESPSGGVGFDTEIILTSSPILPLREPHVQDAQRRRPQCWTLRDWELSNNAAVSLPYYRFYEQADEQKRHFVMSPHSRPPDFVDQTGTRIDNPWSYTDDAWTDAHATRTVMNDWKEQGIWRKEWDHRGFPTGHWKHEEKLAYFVPPFQYFVRQATQTASGGPSWRRTEERINECDDTLKQLHKQHHDASRPFHQFNHQISCISDRVETHLRGRERNRKSLPNINSFAYRLVKSKWKAFGLWNPKWSVMPDMTWNHELSLEQLDRDARDPGIDTHDGLPSTDFAADHVRLLGYSMEESAWPLPGRNLMNRILPVHRPQLTTTEMLFGFNLGEPPTRITHVERERLPTPLLFQPRSPPPCGCVPAGAVRQGAWPDPQQPAQFPPSRDATNGVNNQKDREETAPRGQDGRSGSGRGNGAPRVSPRSSDDTSWRQRQRQSTPGPHGRRDSRSQRKVIGMNGPKTPSPQPLPAQDTSGRAASPTYSISSVGWHESLSSSDPEEEEQILPELPRPRHVNNSNTPTPRCLVPTSPVNAS